MVGSDARLEAAEWDIFIVIWDVVSGPSGGSNQVPFNTLTTTPMSWVVSVLPSPARPFFHNGIIIYDRDLNLGLRFICLS